MDKLSVVNIKIKENAIERNAELVNMAKSIKKHTGKDLFEMLPKQPWHDADFELKGTYAGFANAIRRVMIEEVPVLCANVKETAVTTDDEFVKGLMDVLVKNINLLPVRQSLDKETADKLTIRLDVFNDTNEVIDVTAADFKIVPAGTKPKKKGGKAHKNKKVSGGVETEEHKVYEDVSGGTEPINELDDVPDTLNGSVTGGVDITEQKLKPVDSPIAKKNTTELDIEYVFPNPNITIVRLRPMKYLSIDGLDFEIGQGFENFGKFTLLNNVRYKPVDIEPFDIYTNSGTRTAEHDCSHFAIGFTTSGNIMPKDVIKKVTDYLQTNLEDLKKFINEYASVLASDPSKKYYETKDLSVSKIDDIFHYKFPNQYFTLMNMIAQRCFILDGNILHCSAGVDRYDTRLGIIKIKHADPNKILVTAIDACIKDLETFQSAF